MKRRRAASCDVVESTESGEQQSESGFWAKIHRRVHELLCPAVHELLRPAAVGIAARPSSLLPDRGSEAEDFARQACEAGDFSKTTALHALRLAKIPWNSSRKNVLPGDVPAVEGMICGLYVYGGTMGISTATQRSPWLVRLLAGLAQAEHPGFPFTSIQVNKNYAARPHVDKNNLGVSLILGLGDYSEGQLWVHDETGSVDLTVEEDITSSGRSYRKGRTYRGQELDIRDQWAVFDGNRLHAVRPFTGERFSLVFFTCGRVSQVPTQLQTALRHWRRKSEVEGSSVRNANTSFSSRRNSPLATAKPELGTRAGAAAAQTCVPLMQATSAQPMAAAGRPMAASTAPYLRPRKRRC